MDQIENTTIIMSNQTTGLLSQILSVAISTGNHSEPVVIEKNILTDGQEEILKAATIDVKPATPLLKLIHDYLLVILLISVMFSMGCGVTLAQVWSHLRRPTAVMVCLVAQFFLVPLLGYFLLTILNLDVLHATGLLILACCPGGVTSNIFTFLADGDLPLSITMTSVATIAALLLMPLNMWLYGRNLETGNLVIPYMEMSVTLVLVTIPVILGMILNWRCPRYTPYITKLGVFAGFGIICFCQTLELIIFPDIFDGVPGQLYIAVILLPAISFAAGYLFGSVCGLNGQICRTIGIEIGIKNVGSALTIVSLSFSIEQLKRAWLFPFLYAFSSFAVIFIVTIIYKCFKKYSNSSKQRFSNDTDSDSGTGYTATVPTDDDDDDNDDDAMQPLPELDNQKPRVVKMANLAKIARNQRNTKSTGLLQ